MASDKMNIRFRITAVDRFTKTMDKATAKLSQVEAMASKVDNDRFVDVDTNAGMASSELQAVKNRADSIPRRIVTRVKIVTNEANRRLDALADSLRTVTTVSQSMFKGGLLTALPMVAPLLASAAGGAGALASALTAAGVGAGAFGAVAVPAITGVFGALKKVNKLQQKVNEAQNPEERAEALAKLEQYYGSLSEAQRKTVKEMQAFSSFYTQFSKKFEKPVLSAFRRSMESARLLLLKLEPAIGSVAQTVDGLVQAFNQNLEAPDIKRFFEWVNTKAAPYLDKLVKGVGNFLAGFLNMTVAFDPLAQSFMDKFLQMSESFREWSSTLESNKGFQNFLKYVREQGPQVVSLIGNLINFLVALGQALAPVGNVLLDLTNKFLAWSTELLRNNQVVKWAVALLPVLLGAFKVLAPVITAVTGIVRSLSPVIKTAMSAFMRWAPWIPRVGAFLLRFAGPIGIISSLVIALATTVIANWDTISSWTSNLVSTVKTLFGAMKSYVVSKVTQLAARAIAKFLELKNSVEEKMEAAKAVVGTILDNILGIFDDFSLYESGKAIIQSAIDGLNAMKSSITTTVSNIASAVRAFWPFSPAKEGPLSDIHRMDFAGPITKSIKKAERPINAELDRLIKEPQFAMSGRQDVYASHTFSSKHKSDRDVLQSIHSELRLQREQLAEQREIIVELEGKAVGRAVEPYVSEVQGRNKSRRQKFSAGRTR